jgi:hypothetical protein
MGGAGNVHRCFRLRVFSFGGSNGFGRREPAGACLLLVSAWPLETLSNFFKAFPKKMAAPIVIKLTVFLRKLASHFLSI